MAMTFLTELNIAEFSLVAMAIGATAVAVTRRASDFAPASQEQLSIWSPGLLLSCGFVLLALLLSASEVTQFLTLDETAIAASLRVPQDRNIVSTWVQGGSHTANLLWIPVTRVLQLFAATPATIDAVLKGMHWLLGIGLTAGIVRNVLALLPWSFDDKRWLAISLAGVLLLLPVDNLALKTLNYDLISLFGSTLAVLFVARAYAESSDARLFKIGLIVAALAAQEKLNASLILLVLCLIVGSLQGAACRANPVRTAVLSTFRALALAIAVSLASYAIAAIFLIGDPAFFVLLKTLPLFTELLTVWIYAPLRFLFGVGNGLADPMVRFWYSWGAALATFVLLPTAAALVMVMRSKSAAILTWLSRASSWSFPVGVTFLVLAGILGLQYVTPVLAPMVPLNESQMTIGALNGSQLHFMTHGAAAHRIAAIGFAYGVLITAFPTVLLVAAGAAALGLIWRPRPAPFFDLMFAVAVATPGILALMNTPTFNRYLNLPILWAAIVMTLRIVQAWRGLPLRNRIWPAVPAVLALMIVEVAPFRPLYAAFRPITVNYPEPEKPAPGHVNFSWTGWGEEAILAGKLIEGTCRGQRQLAGVACENIGIWSVYDARWYPRSGPGVHQIGGGPFHGDDWPAGPDTYYVINRQLIAGGLLTSMPSIMPDFTVGYRGFAMAWIFRADRLKAAGYTFTWQ